MLQPSPWPSKSLRTPSSAGAPTSAEDGAGLVKAGHGRMDMMMSKVLPELDILIVE